MKNLLTYIIIILVLSNYSLLSQSSYNKVGGVCFRVDDSVEDPSERLIPYINVFNERELNFTYCVNFGYNLTSALNATLHQMQTDGFEIADHTPDHETRFFDVPLSDINIYQGLNGVDHINTTVDEARICLVWDQVKSNTYTGEGLISISGNTVTSSRTDEFRNHMKLPSTLDGNSMDAIYIPSINKLFKFVPGNVTNNTITHLKSFWGEDNVNLSLTGVAYHKVGLYDVSYSINALQVLAGRTQKVCSESGLVSPTTWIQPGGQHPQFYRADLKAALEPLGYTAAGNFADPVPFKIYNSYDPYDDNRYGMNWEDFNEESKTLDECKKEIADNFAKHYVSIGQSHLLNGSSISEFNNYLQKTADILDWCLAKGIPVKTYKEWAELLYETPQNPYVNVMPSIDVDLDEDNNPDGFDYYSGIIEDGVPGNFSKSFSISSDGQICSIWDLGGVEKGENDFGVWIKGIGEIEVGFAISVEPFVQLSSYTFYSNSTDWVKHNYTFQIPETISEIKLIQLQSVNTSGTIQIGGLELRKNSSNQFVKVFLEGPYNGLTMNTSLNSQGLIPHTQPYNIQPRNYVGAESVTSIPPDVVDWILLDLRTGVEASSIIGRRAAFLKSDGRIVDLDGNSSVSFPGVSDGNYYLAVHHRNHLSIMSAIPLSFSNGNITTNYDFATGQDKAYGTDPMVALSGSFGMIAGDANNSYIVTAADVTPIITNLNNSVYNGADANMSAIVTAADITKVISNLNKATNVPN